MHAASSSFHLTCALQCLASNCHEFFVYEDCSIFHVAYQHIRQQRIVLSSYIFQSLCSSQMHLTIGM